MADQRTTTDGPDPFLASSYDTTLLPDFDTEFCSEADFDAFAAALAVPEVPSGPRPSPSTEFITALNDWRPVYQHVRTPKERKRRRRPPRRGKDETREGFVYTLLKWPLLLIVLAWIIVLGAAYIGTRLYIFSYENMVTNRGQRERLRRKLTASVSYADWVKAAKELDRFLRNDEWMEVDEYAYYNCETVRNVRDQLRTLRRSIETGTAQTRAGNVEELRSLIEAATKENFVGTENSRLYSETYYGTKKIIQSFIDELELALKCLSDSDALQTQEKTRLFRHLYTNYGRTALCLSGGATFAYYHFGVAKALLDADVLPEVITGTSGGALVAALLSTRTDAELKKLLVPALAGRINACSDNFSTWSRRWWRTGARFDSIEWARHCSWFCRGSLTFQEAYERTGRILNVTCIPSDPHSPTVLANHLTSPDCVIWSAVLASAAVPGILNPVVLMKKTRSGKLEPYSFGHKWKDGSLRTDIPLKALNTHFNVTFSIVSQVNPHINIFFFSSRGTVGRPVTHRRGRGWRGGYIGSATEQFLKLDLTKWLKVLRHLELLPRPMGQDWSEVWLQRFSGTITIWPKSILADFFNILSDPPPARLARMIHVGQQSAFPKLKFIANRMKVEKIIEAARKAGAAHDMTASTAMDNGKPQRANTVRKMLSQEDLEKLLQEARNHKGSVAIDTPIPRNRKTFTPAQDSSPSRPVSPGWLKVGGWWSPSPSRSATLEENDTSLHRRTSVISELGRQSRVFFDDDPVETELENHDDEGSAMATDDSAMESDGSVDEEKSRAGRKNGVVEDDVDYSRKEG